MNVFVLKMTALAGSVASWLKVPASWCDIALGGGVTREDVAAVVWWKHWACAKLPYSQWIRSIAGESTVLCTDVEFGGFVMSE